MNTRPHFATRGAGVSKRSAVRKKGVKRYDVQGVTYTYHTASGTRLPNLPYDHPAFIEAYDRAVFQHETKTDSAQKWGFQEDVVDIRDAAFKLSKEPDAVAFTVPDIIRFVVTGKRDQVLIYHSGNLALDGERNDVVRDKQRYSMLAAESGLLTLQQSRMGPGAYQYYAIRTAGTMQGLPQHAIYGRITPDEYTALNAINERQASISVSRVIRDALSLTDAEATEWRNSMIRRGWLTNGRPPELTTLGLSLLH